MSFWISYWLAATLAQGGPLDPIYPLVSFDALRVKIRDEGMVRNAEASLPPPV
jgi:hypothetical protein